MAYKDNESVLNDAVALPIQSIATDTTTNGNAIDMSGYESIMFVLQTGAVTDGDYTPLLKEGDDNNVANATNVADADILPTGTGQEASAALNSANSSSKIGYRGTKQYVFLNVVSANTTTGATVGAVAIQGHPKTAPVS